MLGRTRRKPSGKLAAKALVPQSSKSNRPSTMQRPYVTALSSIELQIWSAPSTMPNRSGSTVPGAIPASLHPSAAAATPSWASRDITFRLLRLATNDFGSKSRTSATRGAGVHEASAHPNRPTPLRCSHSEDQKRSRPMPIGLTTPKPVITTSDPRIGTRFNLRTLKSSYTCHRLAGLAGNLSPHSAHRQPQSCRPPTDYTAHKRYIVVSRMPPGNREHPFSGNQLQTASAQHCFR